MADAGEYYNIWKSRGFYEMPTQEEIKPIFDSQRRFLLERCSPGAASRAIQVLGP